jgi:phosphoserine phosphatase
LHERAALLKGLSCDLLDRLSGIMTLNPGAATLVRTLRAAGTYCALVTGGFHVFADPIAALCGFHEVRANHLETKDGTLCGSVSRPILGPAGKLGALRDITAARDLAPEDACAVGDGANDLAMLEAAGLGVAYRGKPLLRARIQPLLDHGDLTGILYLQGYRRADFQDPTSSAP